MYPSRAPNISVPIIQAIEDAILLGNIKELYGVLDLIKEDETFPENLRYGLEALLYFRLHYGKNGDLAPTDEDQHRKVVQLESSWGRELIEMIGHYPDLARRLFA